MHNVHICVCTSKREYGIYRAGRGKSTQYIYSLNNAPEPTSDSATNISKLFASVCVYLLVYVSWSRKPTYTHYVHTY